MRFTSLLCVPLLAACLGDTTPITKGDDPFELGEPGKADGMLSAADKARLEQAFDSAITAAEATVARLEQEIATLEAGHAAKQREADDLVRRIEQREQELRDQYNRNLALCLFFPDPSICILANVISNDSTLRAYRQQLEAARAEQARIRAEIQTYRAKRDALRARIAPIREGKQRLVSMLQSPGAIELPLELESAPAAGQAWGRAQLMERLSDAIASEIDLLVQIRNATVELSQVLDASLATLRALEQSVDQLVTEQRERFMDRLFDLLSGDPDALAQQWLEEALAARTRELLDALEWPLGEFVRYLVESRDGGGDPEQLIERLLQRLAGQASLPPVIVRATTPVLILDNTRASSPIDVADTRIPQSIEVFVDIEHTYIGDLVVWLEKGDRQFILSNRVGGSQDDLVKTFALGNLQGITLAGRWTLHVEDRAELDTGRLRRWELTAR
jgi:hypothetical protein